MTDAQRRFMQARDNFRARTINPMAELLDAAQAAVVDANQRAGRAETALEVLRPHWAQGFTSDSIAAQASASALSTLWGLLGVGNQTAAVARLQALLEASEADSLLAAAAPELLEALETIMGAYTELADSGDAGYWKAEDTDEGKKALAAIAKARGQTEGQ